MMPETVREMAAGRAVKVARLFQFDFLSGTKRFWDGLGDLPAGGHTWQGAGDLISVSGLEWAEGLAAAQATFLLAATTPEIIQVALTAEIEAKNRPCAVMLQFLSERYVALDQPVGVWAGRMDRPIFKGDVRNQQINLTAETLFVDRIRAPWGLQTDTDQQARFPGDRGFEFMPTLINKDVDWLRG